MWCTCYPDQWPYNALIFEGLNILCVVGLQPWLSLSPESWLMADLWVLIHQPGCQLRDAASTQVFLLFCCHCSLPQRCEGTGLGLLSCLIWCPCITLLFIVNIKYRSRCNRKLVHLPKIIIFFCMDTCIKQYKYISKDVILTTRLDWSGINKRQTGLYFQHTAKLHLWETLCHMYQIKFIKSYCRPNSSLC